MRISDTSNSKHHATVLVTYTHNDYFLTNHNFSHYFFTSCYQSNHIHKTMIILFTLSYNYMPLCYVQLHSGQAHTLAY